MRHREPVLLMIYDVNDPYYQQFLTAGKDKGTTRKNAQKRQGRQQQGSKVKNAPKAAPQAQSA